MDNDDYDWRDHAECRVYPSSLFFGPRFERKADMILRETSAKRVCGDCSVRRDCLSYALINNEKYGIWGGKTEKERGEMRKTARLRSTQTC